MRTVEMTLDEELANAVDRMVKKLSTTRSAFTREALRAALARSREREMERKHRERYLRNPPKLEEFQIWRRNRFGVSRETRRGSMVQIPPAKQKTSSCHTHS